MEKGILLISPRMAWGVCELSLLFLNKLVCWSLRDTSYLAGQILKFLLKVCGTPCEVR